MRGFTSNVPDLLQQKHLKKSSIDCSPKGRDSAYREDTDSGTIAFDQNRQTDRQTDSGSGQTDSKLKERNSGWNDNSGFRSADLFKIRDPCRPQGLDAGIRC